jgi:metacaspase-1
LHTGRALCIGVDTSESHGALAERDACALAELAQGQGFRSCTTLLGHAATRAEVGARLQDAAHACEAGDLLMLTFSGHGGSRGCTGGPASHVSCGTWVLFDGSLDDAQMHGALASFRAGVRVLVISDSCNGGVPADVGAASRARVSASVLVLCACGQDRYADAAGLPGHFTAALLRAWNASRDVAGYPAFYQRIVACMPAYQRPGYHWVGCRDPRFEAQTPFTI